ncbi:DUF904 domain-containing protein [Glaciimonas soli]|uniref:DUF904 domain-containing protein n=1 Tax=Glaciimonas soli TaxID=2590999 RepID=UPI001D177980|nr:DUF904 domain-containing protein [Glaciimonas soli]
MISEFHQLSEKIRLLAELTQSLRLENKELRKNVAALTLQNTDLTRRINTAHQRVSTLLNKIPAPPQDDHDLVQNHGSEHDDAHDEEII